MRDFFLRVYLHFTDSRQICQNQKGKLHYDKYIKNIKYDLYLIYNIFSNFTNTLDAEIWLMVAVKSIFSRQLSKLM